MRPPPPGRSPSSPDRQWRVGTAPDAPGRGTRRRRAFPPGGPPGMPVRLRSTPRHRSAGGRPEPVWRSTAVNRALRAATIGVLLLSPVVLSSCSAGQVTQTATQERDKVGAQAQVGDISVREGELLPPRGGSYQSGDDAELRVALVNGGTEDDTLVSVDGEGFASAEISSSAGASSSGSGFASSSVATSSAAPTSGPSASTPGSSSGAATSSAAPTAGAAPT